MSENYELLQQFVPEYKMLRLQGSEQQLSLPGTAAGQSIVRGKGALRLEVVVEFSWTVGGAAATHKPATTFGFSFLGGKGNVTVDCTALANTGEAPGGCMIAIVSAANNTATTLQWMPVLPVHSNSVYIHTIIDRETQCSLIVLRSRCCV